MIPDLDLVLALRRVLESASEGRGVAHSLVAELPTSGSHGADIARRVLLGFPPEVSMRPTAKGVSEEVAILTQLITQAASSSALLIGAGGAELSFTLEKWVKLREARRIESRVVWFRSVITSGVLGAVTAMIGSLGPVLGSLDFLHPQAPKATDVVYAAAALAIVSSTMLGISLAGRKFYVNVAVTMVVFSAVDLLVSPLVNSFGGILWGIK